ncbi:MULTISPECIES: protease modulator HflC [spotted fever group]|uniref:Protein HflC n=8 Tax=spotted fever group TaxID=114277 RepID=B0BW93_RICRO|nr:MULTISPECIES: protease modulator HflC [spotted fever group]ABV75772.1 Membrane protease subunits [Rickettsia rickettsii str. 'Sheila Smith']ABY72119.1 protease activity modulator [Rickettsia rickettsii str. Iowa]ACR47505.1 protease activity modulator [Rickettsia peacockii str. Rustic]AEV91834.1 Membrane protease subunit, stomatin/prohibitin-like protein [Rickettsia slovaca 13-B]AFB22664.1 protease activity modulator [Rickettsia rickettsii str. Brazil]
MQQKIYYIIFTIVFGLILISSSLFSVDQRQSAVVFQFGEAVRTIENPGLNIKIPFIQNVEFFDKRLLDVEVEAKELTAADGKRVIVDAYAKFQINNPVMFYKTVHDYQGVKIRLTRNLESSMRKVIGKISLSSLLSQERSNVMLNILNQVDGEAKSFGIDVVDVRILRADLPKENSAAIYRRMQTAREKEATQIRAEGQEESVRIRSKADKESKIILAKAYRDAQIIKGDGDEKAAKIYNSAYSVDPEFYKFYRSLLVYKNSLKKENTNFVISPDAEVLKYLNLTK